MAASVANSVLRALQAIKRHRARPEQIDRAILAAINVTLHLASGGDDRVSEGINNDVAANGSGFRRAPLQPPRMATVLQ